MHENRSAPLVFTFDIGTSSLRTTLVNGKGERVEGTTAQQSYALKTSKDGAAELSPAVLRRAALACAGKTLEAYRKHAALRKEPIAAVATSCFWHSLIGTDARGRAITPIHTWADSRCRMDAARLREELREREVHARTGCMLRASFWPAKLEWLHRTQRALFRKVARWMSPAEWLYREFTGGAQCGLSMASGTGLLNARTLDWDDGLLSRFRITREHLNPLTEDTQPPGKVARLFPELSAAPWYPALGDGAASNLGSGATQPGLAAINVGTSAALRVMRAGKVKPPEFGLFCYRVDAERHLIGGAVSNAGNLRAWCLRELRLDEAELEAAMAARPLPKHGLTVLPFWSAERAPTWVEERRGCLAGLTASTDALDILQATTEASYYRIGLIADLIMKQEKKAPRFIVSGGIQKSACSLQRLANVLGQPLYPNEEPEASIRGAAVYVLERLGAAIAPLKLGRAVRPRAAAVAAYARARERQAELEAGLPENF